MLEQANTGRDRETNALYAALEERILDRDQVGASHVYYDLFKAERPLTEMLSEAVRIHGPYTHVPYHERIDDGFVNFVNNDHCLLSARGTLHLTKMLPGAMSGLPMAQTIWYIPTGLDIWNQKILKAPGHYARGYDMPPGPSPAPVVHWPDQEPLHTDGSLPERLGHWLTLVQRGEVIEAYRVFLGVMENEANRKDALAHLVFAGLMDVQDRTFYNRSYTTGHKSYRARATVELGNAIGWDNAHHVLYAGALDIAVGPRWYSTYEMACNAMTGLIQGDRISAIPYSGTYDSERAILANDQPLNPAESEALVDALINQPEPAYLYAMTDLLKAGKSPRRVLDVIQVGAAQVVIETLGETNFSIAQHCYEYCNTLGWFYDTFDHPHRLKLLYLAASFLNRNAWNQINIGDRQPTERPKTTGADRMSGAQILDRVEEAITALDPLQSDAWTQAYLDSGEDRAPLIERLATMACRIGNDPHNQVNGHCFIEDYLKNKSWDRDRLLVACAHHTAGHRKYGDPFEASRRFMEAVH